MATAAGALAEGRDLAIRGDIRETRWEKDGEARSELALVAETLRFADRKPA